LALVALSAAAKAPGLTSTWAKTYGGAQADAGSLLKDNGDGTYFISGQSKSTAGNGQDPLLMKVDNSGAILWQKTYGTAVDDFGWITAMPDGGFSAFFSGAPASAPLTLMKLDGSGEISWQKTYGTAGDTFSAAQALSGGEFLLSGVSVSYFPPTPHGTVRLMKLDAGGNILWQKKYTSAALLLQSILAVPSSDGTYIANVSGFDIIAGSITNLLLKLDSTGGIVWQKSFSVPTGAFSGSIVPASDGGYLYQGAFNPDPEGTGTTDILIAKVDGSGDVTWQKTYGGAKDDSGFLLPITGGYILSGSTKSYSAEGNENAFLAKLDVNGNVIWAKTYGGTQEDSLAASPDTTGGFLLHGSTMSYGSTRAANADFWAVKVNDSGEIQWQRGYGGANEDGGSLHRLAEGGLLLVGDTKSVGAGDSDIWIWKLDSQGELGFPCPFLHDTSTTATPITLGTGTGTLVAGTADVVMAESAYASASGSLAKQTIAFSPQDACTGTPALSATASASVSSGPAPLSVNFTGAATNGTPPYRFSWTFGDGSGNPFQQNPSHTYSSPGSFPVTLTVSDAANATSTDSHLVITVTGGGICTVACTAPVPSSGMAGVPVAFTSTFSAPYCPGPPVFAWTFGEQMSTSTEQNTSHTYTSPGTYMWSFTVTVGGQVCTKEGTIAITQGGCALDCSATAPAAGTVGAPVQFTGSAAPSNCAGQIQFAWIFGDQTPPSDELNPSHTYAAAGAYNWTMTATVDGIPCTKTGSITITAQASKPGDCNGDGTVSIGEVQKAINMFLGLQAIDCGVDCNGDATVSIGEVQRVINGFLGLPSSC
jgi:PKD repeat protein